MVAFKRHTAWFNNTWGMVPNQCTQDYVLRTVKATEGMKEPCRFGRHMRDVLGKDEIKGYLRVRNRDRGTEGRNNG